MVTWPAVIHYHGDNELLFVASHAIWLQDPDLHAAPYSDGDRLIDSCGYVYELGSVGHVRKVALHSDLAPSEKRVSLDEMSALVKAHMSLLGSCCVAKITLLSIAEGVQMLEPE